MSYLDGVDESERVTEEFWAESRRKRKANEEHEARLAAANGPHDRFAEMLRHIWTGDALAALNEPMRWGPDDLDEWLSEENPYRLTHFRVPGVLEALGLTDA